MLAMVVFPPSSDRKGDAILWFNPATFVHYFQHNRPDRAGARDTDTVRVCLSQSFLAMFGLPELFIGGFARVSSGKRCAAVLYSQGLPLNEQNEGTYT